jgi:hypothetical protein
MIFANIDLANRKRHAALRPFNMDKVHESVSTKIPYGRMEYLLH